MNMRAQPLFMALIHADHRHMHGGGALLTNMGESLSRQTLACTQQSQKKHTGLGVLLRPASKTNSACIGNKSTKSTPILFVKSTPASMHAAMPDYTQKRCRQMSIKDETPAGPPVSPARPSHRSGTPLRHLSHGCHSRLSPAKQTCPSSRSSPCLAGPDEGLPAQLQHQRAGLYARTWPLHPWWMPPS